MPDPVPLSAAEALILLDPERWHGRDAVKVTLLVLLARGALRLDVGMPSRLFRRRKVSLQIGAAGAQPEAHDERALLDLVRSVARWGGRIDAVISRARAQYGADFRRFERDIVRSGLIAQGLLIEHYRTVLWLFQRRCDVLTAAGRAERRRVEAALDAVRRIPAALDRDPAEAAALAVAAGLAVFLVPELKGHYTRLSAALRDRGGSDGGFSGSWDWQTVDFSGFDCTGAFDSLDDAMAGFDAGFDGTDGGGDGGGDGGSSGC